MGDREFAIAAAPEKNAMPENFLAALISDRVMNMIGSRIKFDLLQEGIWF
jgi:hypothetical protein